MPRKPRCMQLADQAAYHLISRGHNREVIFGHLWQGRFKSPIVQPNGYWLSCDRYIERNPLEAQMVSQPWDYPWSSCRAYSCSQPDPLLTEDPVYVEISQKP